MTTRIYKVDVDTPNTKAQRSYLVDATSAGQAKSYVASKFVTCAIAKPREIVSLLQEGVTVETAGEAQS